MKLRLLLTAAALLLVGGGTASANSVPLFDTTFGLGACTSSPCASTVPANEPFSVRGGFAGEPRDALVNPSHRFELSVDGAQQQGITDLDLGEGTKWYVFNYRAGMVGVHTFVGCWYATDGALSVCGTRTVTFT